jgi:DNA-binding transcriptional LysR family regulator
VRVTASELMACEVLPPILASFCAGYPTVEIELSVSNQVQNLLRRDADIALRTARPKQGSLVAKHVGSVRLGLFAHRSYAEARGIPRTIAELRQHRLIGFDHDDTSFRAVGVSRLPISRETFGFRSDSDLAQLAALRAGVGIAGCQIRISARDDQLVPVLPMEVRFRVELWLVTHKDLRATRRVRLLFDHLAKGLKAYASAP